MILLFVNLLMPSFGVDSVLEVGAWNDCPKGMVNDPYPGECSRYVDTDGNDICDHSEPAPEDGVAANESTTLVGEQVFESQNSNSSADVSVKSQTENKAVVGFLMIIVPLLGFVGYVSLKKFRRNA